MLSHREEEDGFTLVELVVAMGIMLVVVGALLSALGSLTGAERTTSSRIDDEQATRLTLGQFSRDVHGAGQVLAEANKLLYVNTVDLVATDGTHIQWAHDPVAGTVVRFVVAGDGSKQQTAVLGHVLSAAFMWSGGGASDLVSAFWATTTDVANCATAIGATVSVSSRPGVLPQTQTVQAAAPNRSDFPGCGS